MFTLFTWSEWVTGGLRAFCPGGLAKPHPVIRTSYQVEVHIGGKGSRTRLSFEMMVQPSFHYTAFLYTSFLYTSLQCSHCRFSSYSHTSLVKNVVYIIWMPGTKERANIPHGTYPFHLLLSQMTTVIKSAPRHDKLGQMCRAHGEIITSHENIFSSDVTVHDASDTMVVGLKCKLKIWPVNLI